VQTRQMEHQRADSGGPPISVWSVDGELADGQLCGDLKTTRIRRCTAFPGPFGTMYTVEVKAAAGIDDRMIVAGCNE
jgi:hypothetical protein